MTNAVVNIFESGFIFYRLLLMESECWDGAQACPNHANIKKNIGNMCKTNTSHFWYFWCQAMFLLIFLCIYCHFWSKVVVRKKSCDFPLVFIALLENGALSLGTSAKLWKKSIPDSFHSSIFLEFFLPDSFSTIGVVKAGVSASIRRSRQ